jgi:2-keto-4-pentenoate hydratase
MHRHPAEWDRALSHARRAATIAGMPTMSAQLDRWALALRGARETGRPIAPLTDEAPDLTIAEAYAVAAANVAARVAAGARVVGHKIGLTSVAVQRQLGVGEPDYGALLDDMEIADGGTMSAADFIAPRVELELAFHLDARLAGPGVTVGDVRAATAAVQPAIEVVDCRIADWRIKLPDTVADNAAAGAFVLGGERRALDELDTTAVEMELWRGGELIERGDSSAVLGDPCAAVAWLANVLGPLGAALEPGHVVLSGAGTRMVPATAGSHFAGRFAELGEIRLSVV